MKKLIRKSASAFKKRGRERSELWINNELPICSIVAGAFNARSRIRGKMISTIRQVRNTSSAGYSQIIDKPTHIANNSMSYVDLIFCTKANVVSKHGVDVSIFEKYDHNITFGKTDIRLPLPLVYVQLVRDYTKANAKNIKKAISNFNCNKAF